MKKTESIFMQMHNCKRTNEGSFYVALRDCFYKADMGNRKKLVRAFPEFFGESLPEFGITAVDANRISQMCVGNGNVQIAGISNFK